ncbi:Protein of unknown function [Cotesia congregata]|uniref:Uncharacterized protein n=1 Tax=Cotesia congregata TaxID=51543 RepID=A0A8J2MJ69_COTCN|nr:Protein of unknown function [Cotesia congregata]
MYNHQIYSFRCAKQEDEFDDLDIHKYMSQELNSNVLAKMRFLLILIFGSGCVSSNNYSGDGQPSIGKVTTKSMTSNPGLLYDPFKKVHLIEEEWKIISYININKLINMNSYNDQQYEATLNHCERYFSIEDCRLYLKVQLFQEIYGELQNAIHRLSQLLDETQEKTNNPRNRVRRAPWFGIVGKVARELFGTMDYSDYEHINRELNKLY